MPEGHKTHFLARRHSELFGGQRLQISSPQGRFTADARRVSGKVFDRCEAVGKHLFYRFDGGRLIHIHLGRYGKYRAHEVPPPAPVGQVRVRMLGRSACLDLNGPTTCRVIDEAERQQVVAKLGPDPLAGGKRSDVWRKIHSSNQPIGALIMDQSVVAGVGNIFRAELFFELGMHPETPGTAIDRAAFDRLWRSLRKMMRKGLKYGKIITVTSREAAVPLAKLEGGDRFRIYGKQHCPACGGEIETLKVAARKLYWCPACQG
jgi:endonuclease-8